MSDTDESSDDSGSESDHSSESLPGFRVENVAKTLADYMEELLQLGDIFSSPVPDQDDDMPGSPSISVMDQEIHCSYASLISVRFPNATKTLVDRLGKVNWEQKQRLQEKTGVTETSTPAIDHTNPNFGAASTVTASKWPYPEIDEQASVDTIAKSFFSSLRDKSQAQTLCLPEELKTGQLFLCGICYKTIKIRKDDEWRHVQTLSTNILLLTIIGTTSTKTFDPIPAFSRTAHSIPQYSETERVG